MGNRKYQLISIHSEEILFEGWYSSLREAVESAVAEQVCLDGVDLRGANLACANLDDAKMTGANLSGANLNGANLSEGVFDNADFRGADLSHSCFAMSSLTNVNMTGASFAATDVTDAVISGCQFSCPSVFTTLFGRAALFAKCIYWHPERGMFKMSKCPIVVQGLSREIVYLDDAMKIGNDFVAKTDIIAAGDRHLEFLYGREVATFIRPVLYENIVNL